VNPLDNVTVLWALVGLAVTITAFALGYLLGQADGLREQLADRHEPEGRDSDDEITWA
jgi:hypothetical protein